MSRLIQPPTSTDPIEILRYFQREASRRETPKSELPTGILEKPAEEIDDKSYNVMKFFADWWSDTEEKAAEARAEVERDTPTSPEELLSREAFESAEEVRRMRAAKDLGVSSAGDSILEMLGAKSVEVPPPAGGDISEEKLDDVPIVTPDVVTDDADGGAAPSDGKGLMSPLAPSESLRPKSRPDKKFNFKETSVRLVSDLMTDFDLTKVQAAALVGNLAWESDNYQGMQEYEPAVKGSRGGYGFAQWTGSRRKMFEKWSKENELDPSSYEANYGFLKFELSSANDEIGSMGVNTIKKLKDAKDLDGATSIVMKEYLRPGIPHEDKRKKRASQVLGLL
jgi:hypothetical protein